MIGKTLGNYEIREPLGAGGMGEVYRAHDTNLKRDVAIKVLPEALAVDTERLARLQREAQLLASVNHPNIAAIYNLEQAEGVRWLVLELVEGTTLEQRLRQGPIPTDEALRIGVQVASALEAAHEKGIVHRDLKSANVMIDGKGRVKVLDFGIAKDISAADEGDVAADLMDTALATQVNNAATHLTRTGVIVGTAPYMSPEQIRGRNIDKRTDNWAFGCLLYELLTGRRPFDRETMADTLAAILEYEPNWDLLPDDAPPSVDALIHRCLQKNADSRLRDIADARIEIEQIVSTGVGSGIGPMPARVGQVPLLSRPSWKIGAAFVATLLVVLAVGWGFSTVSKSAGDPAVEGADVVVLPANAIAVLPFEFAGDRETEYFSEGTAQAVRIKLEGISGLTVKAWESAKAQDRTLEPLEIGRSLGVSKYVEGRVRTQGDDQMVAVSLVDAATGDRLWRGEFIQNRNDTSSFFQLQEDVALRVVEALEFELSDDEAARLRNRPTASAAAYDAYLRGLDAFPRRRSEDLIQARDHFEEAVRLDADFAEAHAGVANTYLFLQSYASLSDDVALPNAERSARRALELDPALGRAQLALAHVAWARRQDGFVDLYERAVELAPNDALVHLVTGSRFWTSFGATERSRELTLRARELNPLDPPAHENLGWWYLTRGQFDAAIEHMQRAVALDPEYALGHMALGNAMVYSGRAEEALDYLRRGQQLNPADSARHWHNLGMAYAALGQTDDALMVFKARTNSDLTDATFARDLGDAYLDVGGPLADAAVWYDEALNRERELRNLYGSIMVWLDQGKTDEAAARIALVEAQASSDRYARLARLNIEMAEGDYLNGATIARELAEHDPFITYETYAWNGTFYANQWPIEPIGYFGVLAGEPGSSLQFFEVNFPELLGEDPPVHVFTLKAAIDLALVLQRLDNHEQADLLLERSLAYLDGIPEQQRHHQFRQAPMHIYALQGHTEEALAAMRQAIDDGLLSGWWRLDKKPHFESIRDDPRFVDMVRELRDKATGGA